MVFGTLTYQGTTIGALGTAAGASVYWNSAQNAANGNTVLYNGGTITVSETNTTFSGSYANGVTYSQAIVMLSSYGQGNVTTGFQWASRNGTGVTW